MLSEKKIETSSKNSFSVNDRRERHLSCNVRSKIFLFFSLSFSPPPSHKISQIELNEREKKICLQSILFFPSPSLVQRWKSPSRNNYLATIITSARSSSACQRETSVCGKWKRRKQSLDGMLLSLPDWLLPLLLPALRIFLRFNVTEKTLLEKSLRLLKLREKKTKRQRNGYLFILICTFQRKKKHFDFIK